MGIFDNPMLLARLAILPLAIIPWASVVWFISYGLDFPVGSWRRNAIGVLTALLQPAVVIGQIFLYRAIAHVVRMDGFGYIVFIGECLISVSLVFYLLKRRTSSRKPTGE